jgi:hypothetical protein
MTKIEKMIVELYEDWTVGPGQFAVLVPLFELMKEKYPKEMDQAFRRGLEVVQNPQAHL